MAAGIPPGTAKAGGGDITGVTAGNGISGGGDSGALSIALDLGTNPGLEIDGSAKLQIAKGISQHDVAQFGAGVDDNDYLHVDGTTIEGFSASEVLSDIGGQASLTFGISNTNAVKVDSASVADDEYARFTASGLESRSTSEVLSDIGGAALTGSTDNTVATVTGANALAGEANLTFDGSTLAVTGAVTVSTDLTVSGGDIVYGNGQNATASVTATAHDAAGRNLTITAGPTTAGTSNNQAGGALTIQGGQGKGSGAGGDIIFQTANAAGSGSSLNALATALTLSDDLSATFAGSITRGDTVITDGVITDSTGLQLAANLDINGTVDISDDLTLSAGADGALRFSVASSIKILDNSTTSLVIEEADNAYMTFSTENDLENVTLDVPVLIDSTPADAHWSGITAKFTAGEDLEDGECVYLKAADTKMWKAVANTGGTGLITAEIMCVAMCVSDVDADDVGVFLLQGFIRADTNFPTYAIGETLYVPEAEVGGKNVPEGIVPDSTGDFVQVIGWAADANTVYFNPDFTIIEHA